LRNSATWKKVNAATLFNFFFRFAGYARPAASAGFAISGFRYRGLAQMEPCAQWIPRATRSVHQDAAGSNWAGAEKRQQPSRCASHAQN
jgi:hypothetical protein